MKTDKNGEARKPEISFKNWNRMMKVSFVIYADFEAFLVNMDSCESDNRSSFTEKYQKHQPCGFCYKIVFPGEIGKLMPKSLLKPMQMKMLRRCLLINLRKIYTIYIKFLVNKRR